MHRSFLIYLFLALLAAFDVQANTLNGFDVENSLVPSNEIRRGGPPRDGIPALNYPRHITAQEANYLRGDDRVIGVVIGDEARAYPIRILDWHEVVNEKIYDQYFVVTYCPLCGTGMVFASNIEGTDTGQVFGVSGLLYNSDVLLFDRQTESLWSQIMAMAVTGELKGIELPQLPARHTTWADWKLRHPQTLVLSDKTGTGRDYRVSPYKGYEKRKRLMFPVSHTSDLDIHPKATVLGVTLGGLKKAYMLSDLLELDRRHIDDTLSGIGLTNHWDAEAGSAWVTDLDGKEIPSTIGFWFAWYAFHPDTLVYQPQERGTRRAAHD